jgi:WD40 repeat protein
MLMPFLHLEDVKTFIIDSDIIEAFLYENINRDYYNHSIEITHSDPEQLQGIVASLISMVRLPYQRPENVKILPMPDEKEHNESSFHESYFFHESFRRVNSNRLNCFDGLGITGELDFILDGHDGKPVTNLLQTYENMVLSASDDGTIVMWRINRMDDYSNLKYKVKKETNSSPINLGNVSDFIFVSYEDVVKIWDQEFCQVEQEVKINGISQVIEVNNSLLACDKKGNLFLKDLKDPDPQLFFKLGPQKGIISQMVKTSEYTIATGTITGHVVLFDLRFNLPSSCFCNSFKQPILSMSNYFCRYKPLIDGAQILTGLSNEVVMWDLLTGRTSVLFTRSKETYLQIPYLLPDPFYFPEFNCKKSSLNLEKLEIFSNISKNFIQNLTEFGASVKRSWETRSNVLKIHVPGDSHIILSTGEDGLVRIWDPISVKNSGILGIGGLIRPEYSSALMPDVLVIQEQAYPSQSIFRKKRDFDELASSRKVCHSHTINDLLFTSYPKPLLLTASNDGTIRVWR